MGSCMSSYPGPKELHLVLTVIADTSYGAHLFIGLSTRLMGNLPAVMPSCLLLLLLLDCPFMMGQSLLGNPLLFSVGTCILRS